MKTPLMLITLIVPALAGCTLFGDDEQPTYEEMGYKGTDATGKNRAHWPSLEGETVTILDHGAFGAFDNAKKAFERLTGATVKHIEADDTGSMLSTAIKQKGQPTYDIIYGIDNLLMTKALDADIFAYYKPKLGHLIEPEFMFLDEDDTWMATPVDHGWIGLNIDYTNFAFLWDLQAVDPERVIDELSDLREFPQHFVTQDPNLSTPGLGFLVATVATFGEDPAFYDWRDFWNDLFRAQEDDGSGFLVVSDWTTAYANHFSGAGAWAEDSKRDKAIVTSYTESPAYEWYWDYVYPKATGDYAPGFQYGGDEENLPTPFTAPGSTFHQIQTMAIAKGTANLAAAQAWIEFTLTDAFQELAAVDNAVYPVGALSTDAVYGDIDPVGFTPADMDYKVIGENLDRWLCEWKAIRERNVQGVADCPY